MTAPLTLARERAVEIRVRGRVQGVGFRPLVWRLAERLGLSGEVRNDAAGVLIRAAGSPTAIAQLVDRLADEAPALARIRAIETRDVVRDWPSAFRIAASGDTGAETEIAPDARVCDACAQEVLDPFERRYRYPFATCTACGPRFSIATAIPYDRTATSMARFALCPDCAAEYRAPADRRFHAETIACHRCGPTARLIRLDGAAVTFDRHSPLDDVDAAGSLLLKGEIVAFKGIGGYQLACDATNAAAVARLRARKHRDRKPFALMARDLDVIRRYCPLGDDAVRLLGSPEGPIVILRTGASHALPEAIAPGLDTLGFMLPTSPLHVLVLRRLDRPVVMTSGNLAEEPQIIDDAVARQAFAGIADYALIHDRPIVQRIDDSVARVTARGPLLLRRARGFVPSAIALPEGLRAAPDLIAYGGELKSTFCLVTGGQAVLSPHIGDLAHPAALAAFEDGLAAQRARRDLRPAALAADAHPAYHAHRLARDQAAALGVPLIPVQHHHAHVAACLADNERALTASPVLGIVLDGLGYGDDGALWGGEFLLADYRDARRLATLKPVAMLGGDQATREPWRNLYAHLMAAMSWAEFAINFEELPLHGYLAGKSRATLDAMLRGGFNAPRASSCGRLFDAVAAALDLCRERQAYEGEAAMRLEAIVCARTMAEDDALAYPFTVPNLPGSGLPYVEPQAMWQAVLGDLILDTPAPVIAARFHKGFARALAGLAARLAGEHGFDTVALSGGCFQNMVLLEDVTRRLERAGLAVLTHARVPPNDGGLALGQAAVAAARLIVERS